LVFGLVDNICLAKTQVFEKALPCNAAGNRENAAVSSFSSATSFLANGDKTLCFVRQSNHAFVTALCQQEIINSELTGATGLWQDHPFFL
jgi:hypothetical protein